jgi:hypothetical protein
MLKANEKNKNLDPAIPQKVQKKQENYTCYRYIAEKKVKEWLPKWQNNFN